MHLSYTFLTLFWRFLDVKMARTKQVPKKILSISANMELILSEDGKIEGERRLPTPEPDVLKVDKAGKSGGDSNSESSIKPKSKRAAPGVIALKEIRHYQRTYLFAAGTYDNRLRDEWALF